MLDSIFGGSTSSRLFREVREKRGLAYSVGSYNEQYTDSGLVATYVGTREDNVEEACAIIGTELERLRTEPVSTEELARAKENVKGRLVLSSESTAARMTRISRATLFDLPIDSLDEMLAKVDAVQVDDLTELAARALRRRAALGRLRRARRGAASARRWRRSARALVERVTASDPQVVVSGAAGRMGQAVCEAVEGAEDMELTARADPALGVELADALDERRRRRRLHHARDGARATRAPACRPASTPSSAPPASTSTSCARSPSRPAPAPTASSPPTSRSARCC